MKQIILPVLLLILHQSVFSQSDLLSISPNPAVEKFSVDLSDPDLDLEIYAEVKNLTKDTLLLKWQRYEMGMPQEWETQVCDPNFCYLPNVDTNYDPKLEIEEPVILPPDSAFTLIFHVLPNGVTGTGTFDLDFSLIDAPEEIIETAVFEAEVTGRSTSIRRPVTSNIRLFPNPTTDYFELTGTDDVDLLVVYNLLGKKVREFQVVEGRRYPIFNLPDDIYLVSLVNRREGILKTLRLSKNSLKP